MDGSVYGCIAQGIGELAGLITDWHHAAIAATSDAAALARMTRLQERIEARSAWNLETRISTTISRLGLPADQDFATLSGGMKRRANLAAGMLHDPRVLFLDEPTVGLHMADVEKLIHVLHRLVDAGNSVVVVEHNLDVMAEADWLIDMGPEGGSQGGRVVTQGVPETLYQPKTKSHTARILNKFLAERRVKKTVGSRRKTTK